MKLLIAVVLVYLLIRSGTIFGARDKLIGKRGSPWDG